MAKLLAYLQLLRLPNVFTAMADILAAFLLAGSWGTSRWALALFVPASCCLYLGGMALNDYFDQDIDARDRPTRPLPSGRVRPLLAAIIGFGLLAAGVAFALAASLLSHNIWPGAVGALLALVIVGYDAWLKRTPLGPMAMGTCRFLNWLLGMSLAPTWSRMHMSIAAAIGVYIMGITWFARSEARISSRRQLLMATGTILLGVGILATELSQLPTRGVHRVAHDPSSPTRAAVMAVFAGAILCRRCFVAVAVPVPMQVQSAVKLGILSLVVLDAIVAFAVAGLPAGGGVVLLVVPILLLGRWVYST